MLRGLENAFGLIQRKHARENMDGAFIIMTEIEQENFLRAIETSLQVKRRHQFFLWTQGQLQPFIPHKILICNVTRDGKESMVVDCFNSCVVSKETFARVCDPAGGLLVQSMQAWREAGDIPLFVAPGVKMPITCYEPFRQQLQEIDFGCAAGHGCPPVEGRNISSSYFLFAGMPETLTIRNAYFLELLMPHIHAAFMRTLGQKETVVKFQETGHSAVDVIQKMMTDREIEILAWVQEGKSNQEIGDILCISPLTVKNHVQKILRKLDVKNRAQAVSKATAMRLIDYAGAARTPRTAVHAGTGADYLRVEEPS